MMRIVSKDNDVNYGKTSGLANNNVFMTRLSIKSQYLENIYDNITVERLPT